MNLTLQEINTMLFGLTKEEARKVVKKHKGSTMRVYIEDGVEYYGETPKLEGRVNVEVKNGKVIGVLDIG